MTCYDELLHMLDLKNVSMFIVWRWLIYLGSRYDKNNNKRYYNGDHERHNVVKDRNECFKLNIYS